MNPLKILLLDYKATRREVTKNKDAKEERIQEQKSAIKNLIKEIKSMEEQGEDTTQLEEVLIEQKGVYKYFIEQKKALLSDLSNLNYAIQWMETSRCPTARRGADNRKGYESNVTYNSEWIKHQSYQDHDIVDDEQDDSISKQKEKFAESILSSLTKRQKEVLQLSANGHNQPEIARLLNISQQAVSQTIQRYEQRIKEEGWVML